MVKRKLNTKRKVGRPRKTKRKRGGAKRTTKRRVGRPCKTQNGDGFWSSANDFLKKTKIVSTVGEYVLPALGGTLGAAAGTFEAPIVGTVEGGILGTAAGTKLNDGLRALGYGQVGGAVYTNGQVPLQRPLVGTGARGRRANRKGRRGGYIVGGSSVYNDVVSNTGNNMLF
tara:strand:- start:2083 stop:2595 length:513 start_codon:yes stop_codon:yes gene_type:complete